jgi:hypothetical protein
MKPSTAKRTTVNSRVRRERAGQRTGRDDHRAVQDRVHPRRIPVPHRADRHPRRPGTDHQRVGALVQHRPTHAPPRPPTTRRSRGRVLGQPSQCRTARTTTPLLLRHIMGRCSPTSRPSPSGGLRPALTSAALRHKPAASRSREENQHPRPLNRGRHTRRGVHQTRDAPDGGRSHGLMTRPGLGLQV